jgi:ABC-type uncharacterized transport system
MTKLSYVWSLAFVSGLIAAYIGERIVGAGSGRGILTGLGLLLVLVALTGRVVRMAHSSGDRQRIERYLLVFQFLGLFALVLYFVQSDLWLRVASKMLNESSPKLAVVLGALWPVLMVTSILPTLLVEISYAGMEFAPRVEAARIQDAALTGLGLSGALVLAFCAVYVATERDVTWDLSYFRTTRPGQASRRIVQTLTELVEVSLFFPPANEVRQEVTDYFQDLARGSTQLSVHAYDQALDPAKARELGVSGNGAVVFSKGSRRETLFLGTDFERARSQLRTLDQDVQKKLLAIGQARRALYFTTGHGERGERTTPTDQRATISAFRDLLTSQNYELRNLGAAEGLASDVPSDAAAVLVIGPTGDFLPEENAALSRYLDHGGRLWIALDPEARLEFKILLANLGIKFVPTVLANDAAFIRRTGQLSDRTFIGTVSFSSHPSVTSLSQLGGRAFFALLEAGYLEELKDRPTGLTVDFTIHAHPATWNDLNGNYQLDGAEKRKSWELAAAIQKTRPGSNKPSENGRVIIVADSDALSDLLFENPGNMYFALDGLKWLIGEEAIVGQVSSEADVPIEHTRKKDVIWFYSTIFLAPALVLAIGFVATRRRSARNASPIGAAAREVR